MWCLLVFACCVTRHSVLFPIFISEVTVNGNYVLHVEQVKVVYYNSGNVNADHTSKNADT